MDKKIVLVSLIGFAFTTKNFGDSCFPILQLDYRSFIDLPHRSGLSCYVSSFDPDHPEQSSGYNHEKVTIDYVTASGINLSNASLSLHNYKYPLPD